MDSKITVKSIYKIKEMQTRRVRVVSIIRDTSKSNIKKMKVLLVNHGTASEWGGGDSVQIIETAKRLKQRGHDVDIQNSDRPEVENFDLVHIFNCRVQQSFMQQVTACQQYKKPIVVSPIWISIGRALWGS